jgi:hypothetical protein
VESVYRDLIRADLSNADVVTKRRHTELLSKVSRLRTDISEAGRRISMEAAERLGNLDDATPAQYRAAVSAAAAGLPQHLQNGARNAALARPPEQVQIKLEMERQAAMQRAALEARQEVAEGAVQRAEDAADEEAFGLNRDAYNKAAPVPIGGMSFEDIKKDEDLYNDYKRKMLSGQLPFVSQKGEVGPYKPPSKTKEAPTVSVDGQKVPVSVFAQDTVALRGIQGMQQARDRVQGLTTSVPVVLDNQTASRIASQAMRIMEGDSDISFSEALQQAAGRDYDALVKAGRPPSADRDSYLIVAQQTALDSAEQSLKERYNTVVAAQVASQSEKAGTVFSREGAESAVADKLSADAQRLLDVQGASRETVEAEVRARAAAEVAQSIGAESLLPGDEVTEGIVSRIANKAMGDALQEHGKVVAERSKTYTDTKWNLENMHGYEPDMAAAAAANKARHGYAAFSEDDALLRVDAQTVIDDKDLPPDLRDKIRKVIKASEAPGGVLRNFERNLNEAGIYNFDTPQSVSTLKAGGKETAAVRARQDFMGQPPTINGVVNPNYAKHVMSPAAYEDFMATPNASQAYTVNEAGMVVRGPGSISEVPSIVFKNEYDKARSALTTDTPEGKLPDISGILNAPEISRYEISRGIFSASGKLKLVEGVELSDFMVAALVNSSPEVREKLQSNDRIIREQGLSEAVTDFGTRIDGVRVQGTDGMSSLGRAAYGDLGYGVLPAKQDSGMGTYDYALDVIRNIDQKIGNADENERRGIRDALVGMQTRLRQSTAPAVNVLATIGDDSASLKTVNDALNRSLARVGVSTSRAYGSQGAAETALLEMVGQDVEYPVDAQVPVMNAVVQDSGANSTAARLLWNGAEKRVLKQLADKSETLEWSRYTAGDASRRLLLREQLISEYSGGSPTKSQQFRAAYQSMISREFLSDKRVQRSVDLLKSKYEKMLGDADVASGREAVAAAERSSLGDIVNEELARIASGQQTQ